MKLPELATLGSLLIGLQGCGTAPPVGLSPLSGAALFDDVRHYESLGVHRYGSAGADQVFDWLARELRAAGLSVTDQAFVMDRQYELRSATMRVEGQDLPVLPQWWLPPAQASFALTAPIVAQGAAQGGFARLNLRFDQGAYLHDGHRQALAAAFARQPAAVLLSIDHPSGEIFTYNVAQTDIPWPVPVILVAPRHAALLDAAQRSGRPVSVAIDGSHHSAVAGRNVIGRLDRGKGRAVVVSTPVTGWHINTCERGPGIATFLALARIARERFTDVDLVFVATAGHEIGHGGMERFLHDEAPPPAQVAAWAHLGASLACVGWRQQDGQWVSDGKLDAKARYLNASTDLAPLVQRHFESVEANRLVGPRAAIGELREVHSAGYTNFFGMAGSHSFFHTTHDTLATTRPHLLEPVARAFADALTEVSQRAAR